MGRKEDAIAGLNALTDKTIENVKLILNHYGFDSFERKAKVLEDMLGIHRDWGDIDRKARFEMLAQYFIEQASKAPKSTAKPKTEKKPESRRNGPEVHIVEMPSGMSRAEALRFIRDKIAEVTGQAIDEEESDNASSKVTREVRINEITSMLKDFDDEEIEKIHEVLSELHEKYEISEEEKAFRALCRKYNLDEDDPMAKRLFLAGLTFARREA
jgi:vacuolar-type H+-ATPase subunit I/STV1